MKNNQISLTKETYAQLGKDFSTYFATDIYGNITEQIDYDHQTYLTDLFEIEKFVHKVILSKEPAFIAHTNRFGKIIYENRPLAKYLTRIYNFSILYSPDYKFSTHVNLFFDSYIKMKLGEVNFNYPGGLTALPGVHKSELFNSFLELIRSEAKTDSFKAKLAKQIINSKNNQLSAVGYINNLFAEYSRYLVMRIDLSYQSKYAKNITAEQAKNDFKRLLNNRRNNHSLFEHFRGYLWKLEWGSSKGCHFHLVIFYDGAHVQKGSYWAEKLGNYWKDHITKGQGIFYNCNASSKKYKRLGIGMISRHDTEKRKILTDDVVSYLTKPEQFFKAIKANTGRCFGKGESSTKVTNEQDAIIEHTSVAAHAYSN